MKRTIKSLLAFLISIVIITSAFIFNTSAAGTIIAFSKNPLTVGDSLSVTVSIDAGAPMYGVMCNVNYNSTVLEYKSGVGAGGAGSLKIVESPSGDTKVSYTLTFRAIKSGSSAISVNDVVASIQGSNGSEEKGLASASANITVNDASLSANADLSALSLSAGSLSPKFNKNTTSYTAAVKNSVTSCKVYATAADSGAKVAVSGADTLKIGKNVRTVTITAPSGAQKVYTITINRSEVETSEPTSEPENNLTTNIEGKEYTVATDISDVNLYSGFTASTGKFNEQEVAVAIDSASNYIIYFLKSFDSNELKPYIYDEVNGNFIKLAVLTQGDNTYIHSETPTDFVIPKDFYATTAKIGENEVKCFASSDISKSDFYYFYCFSNGQYGYYRYDKVENTMQRYPEMLDLIKQNTEIPTEEPQKDQGFLTRFNSLSSNAKIIVIAIPLLIIVGIALVVVIIVKLFGGKNDAEYDDNEDFINDKAFEGISFGEFANNEDQNHTETAEETAE